MALESGIIYMSEMNASQEYLQSRCAWSTRERQSSRTLKTGPAKFSLWVDFSSLGSRYKPSDG